MLLWPANRDSWGAVWPVLLLLDMIDKTPEQTQRLWHHVDKVNYKGAGRGMITGIKEVINDRPPTTWSNVHWLLQQAVIEPQDGLSGGTGWGRRGGGDKGRVSHRHTRMKETFPFFPLLRKSIHLRLLSSVPLSVQICGIYVKGGLLHFTWQNYPSCGRGATSHQKPEVTSFTRALKANVGCRIRK